MASKSAGILQVKELEYQPRNELGYSKLVLEISNSGKSEGSEIDVEHDIDSLLVHCNTLRRVAMDDIPIYAFPPERINIEANNTIFNNDYMKLRLSQIPIFDVESEIYYLEKQYWEGVNYASDDRPKHPKEKNIEIYINSYNNTPDLMNVTTNDIIYLEDGEQMEKYDKKYPILIIQLRPNETFKCHMRSALGVGQANNIFCAASNAFYEIKEDEKENKLIFTIESQGQMSEHKILEKASMYISKRVSDIKKYILENIEEVTEDLSRLEITLEHEDHTMGGIINLKLQEHPKIIYSGLAKPDHLVNTVKITVATEKEGETNIKKYISDQINDIIEEFESFSKKINKKSDKSEKKEIARSTSTKKTKKKSSKSK